MAFSVVMSVYAGNVAEQLGKSISSTLNQTLPPAEFVIVADGPLGSDLRAMIEQFRDRYESISLVQLEQNQGLGAALREGVEKCCHDLVARMDADDICFPDRFERQVEFLERNPKIDILGGAAVEIDSEDRAGRMRVMPCTHDEITSMIWSCPIIHPSVMFRRQSIIAVGSYDAALRRGQDYELWFRAVHGGLRFANLPDPVVYHRFTDDNLRRQPPRRNFEQAIVGWRGCRMLRLRWWQHLAVWYPFFRSLMPLPLLRLGYRFSQRADPRLRQRGRRDFG